MTKSSPAELDDVYCQIARYYTQKVRRYGPTPLGTDWSCAPTQALRFRKLLALCNFDAPFSLNDIGCGYGALLDYLALYHPQSSIDYLGIDVSSAMVRHAKKRWAGDLIQFHHGGESPRPADYSIASGIFNVMLDQPIPIWERLIETTLFHLSATSRKGFAVNFVHQPNPEVRAKAGLYCADPMQWIDFCEKSLGSEVNLIENYGMSEFTLLIRPIQVSSGN